MAETHDEPGHGDEQTRGSGQRTLGEKINRLCEVMRPAGQRPPSNRQIAKAITEGYGLDISPNYIWSLRHGERDNPGLRYLEALAWYFGVSLDYFSGNGADRRIDDQLDLLEELRDAGVDGMAFRTARASGPTREAIKRFVRQATDLDKRHPWHQPPADDE